jgi:glycine cleavage system aminomethyltransferase T
MATIEDPGILLYPRIRKSPYFYASRKHGITLYSVYNRTYHPRSYGDIVGEYWHMLEKVTLWDVGVERQVEITGPDAFELTNMLVPRDLTKCRIGQCKYVFVTNPEGGIINDPVLLRLGENHFWLSLADSDTLLWARGLAHGLGMNVTITEPDVGPVQVQGPRSVDVMSELFGPSILEVPYYYAVERELDGMDVVVSRTGFSGEVGYEIYLRNASRDGMRLWDTVMEAGEASEIRPIAPSHVRRIEGGFLSWGNDITQDTNPFEVGYGFESTWMVDLDQEADFIGKEALRRIKAQGVTRKLVGVEIAGPNVGYFNDGSMIDTFPVSDPKGLRIGDVTSACWSLSLEKNIGYAMVPVAYESLGTELVIETQHGPQDAVVVEKPFIDPHKDKPKVLKSAVA